jgi:hypothetical protein
MQKDELRNSPARPKGRPNPVATSVSNIFPLRSAELTGVSPELEDEALLQRIEWQVASGALGVMVRARELGPGGLEPAAGNDHGGLGGAESCTRKHLGRLEINSIGVLGSVLWRRGVERRRMRVSGGQLE